jgi:hypothetical protein
MVASTPKPNNTQSKKLGPFPSPLPENTEIDVDRDPWDDPDQGHGEILHKRDIRHAQRIILQVERHDRAETHKHHDLPAVFGYCPVKLPIFRTAVEEGLDFVLSLKK